MDTPELNQPNFDSSLASSRSPEAGASQAEGCGLRKFPATGLENVNAVATRWVESHGDYLFNFAFGQMRDVNTAEDLVQETFLAALKSQNNFSGRSSERTWLVGILRHKIYDHLRKACRERAMRFEPLPAQEDSEAFDESLLWIHQVAAESTSPSRRLELAEFREHLEKAMSKLPPRIAQVFQLYSIEECTNQEVCGQLNISESNLWVMLHRARKQLSEAFAGWRDFAQTRQQKSVAARNSRGAHGPKQ
jgi:RNA polymerase sigma-70 factor (ECF subfamily)